MLPQSLLRHYFHQGTHHPPIFLTNFYVVCSTKFDMIYFSFRYVHPADKNDIAAQVRMAAQCCKLTDTMISRCDHLWTVPQRLIEQARQMNTKNGANKRHARKMKNPISPIMGNSGGAGNQNARNANYVHKIVI